MQLLWFRVHQVCVVCNATFVYIWAWVFTRPFTEKRIMLSHIMPLRPFLVTRGRILLSGGRRFEANLVSAACRFAHRFGPWASCYWCSCLGHPMPFSPFPAHPSNASPKEIQAFACRHHVATQCYTGFSALVYVSLQRFARAIFLVVNTKKGDSLMLLQSN